MALYSYTSTVADDLTFNKGDILTIVSEDGQWWTGTKDGRTGTFPANYVKKLAPASKVIVVTAVDSVELSQKQIDGLVSVIIRAVELTH